MAKGKNEQNDDPTGKEESNHKKGHITKESIRRALRGRVQGGGTVWASLYAEET